MSRDSFGIFRKSVACRFAQNYNISLGKKKTNQKENPSRRPLSALFSFTLKFHFFLRGDEGERGWRFLVGFLSASLGREEGREKSDKKSFKRTPPGGKRKKGGREGGREKKAEPEGKRNKKKSFAVS